MNKRAEWKVTDYRYVGYIDIMGFKDLVARKSHKQVYELMTRVVGRLKSIESMLATFHSDEEESLAMAIYSDSIMVYSKDAEYESRTALTAAMANFSYILFKEKVPFKGAVAYGEMTLDFKRSIFFGQPLIDAFLLQEQLAYYGIVIHATAENEVGHNIDEEEAIIEYDTPFKNGSSKNLTVMPGISFIETYDQSALNEVYDNVLRLRFNTSGPLRRYIDNTLTYLNYIDAEGKKILAAQHRQIKKGKRQARRENGKSQ